MSLGLEELKVIRLALSKYPLSKQVMDTMDKVDAELAEHGVKVEWVALPKRKYQRGTDGEYKFVSTK